MSGTWKSDKGKSLERSLPEGEKEKEIVVNVDPNYPEKYDLSETLPLPKQAKILYGCLNCEWRQSGVCPFEYDAGRATQSNVHRGLICQERTNWLVSLGGVSDARIGFTRWQANFNRCMGQVVLNRDYFMIQRLEGELQELLDEEGKLLKDCSSGDDLEGVQKRIDVIAERKSALRTEFFLLWREIAKVDESRLNREAPKKIDLNVSGKLNLSDIHSIMRGSDEIVDAEFEEKEDG